MAAVVLGHHAITCLMKAAAQHWGIVIRKGTSFPEVLGMLNKNHVFVKGEAKSLELLNKVRNDIEHDEPNFIRDEFEVALTDCLHIVEILSTLGLPIDVQNLVSLRNWEYLIDIGKFGDERRSHLTELLDEELGVYGKDRLSAVYEYVICTSCGELGILWQGEDDVITKCKYCGEEVELKACIVCHGLIQPDDDSYFDGQVHQACFDRWGE
jgi:hypothetical protein